MQKWQKLIFVKDGKYMGVGYLFEIIHNKTFKNK